MATLTQRWMGRGNEIKAKYSIKERIAGALDITRPILSFMGMLGVASAAALANKGFPDLLHSLVGIAAAFLAFAGIHTFNDFIDSRRDESCWPGRPVPSKRISVDQAILFSITLFVASLVLIAVFFNIIVFILSFVVLILGCLYSSILRDKVGYLVLPPIQSLLWLLGWAAFSPETLFTSPVPWILYVFSIFWQAGHILIYSPLHPSRKIKGEFVTEVPAFIKRLKTGTTVMLGFVFFCISIALALFIGFYLHFGLVFYIPVAIMGLIALFISLKYLQDYENFLKGIKSFSFVTYFMLVTRIFILVSVFMIFQF